MIAETYELQQGEFMVIGTDLLYLRYTITAPNGQKVPFDFGRIPLAQETFYTNILFTQARNYLASLA